MQKFKKNPKCNSAVVVVVQGILSHLSGALDGVVLQRNNIIRLKREKKKKRVVV